MFKSVLVANRGEIACRVFRTAKRMGICTIAVYSEADATLQVREADEAVLIGPAAARESYLDGAMCWRRPRRRARRPSTPDGFLSENADFAEGRRGGGPDLDRAGPVLDLRQGLKDAAKELMIQAGVPYRGLMLESPK